MRLPFEFSRDDIPYVPPGTGIVEGRTAALASAPRMPPRGQVRGMSEHVNGWILAPNEDLPWVEYHRRIEGQKNEGRRAVERISAAADSSDEPYIHMDPHPLLAGGQNPHAGRLGPKTRKYEVARGAEKSLWTGQDQAAGPRRDRQSFYNILSVFL